MVADLRGHGESPAPPADGGYEISALAGDCLALLDRLAIDRLCVAGSDLGGAVALELAVTAPDRIAAIAVSDCTPARGWPADDAMVAGFERIEARRLAAAEAGGMEAVAESVLDYEAPPRVSEDPGPRRNVIARWTAVSAEGYVGCARAMRDRPDRTGDLAALAPQLWLAGELGEMREAVRRAPELAPGNAQATIIRHSGPGCAWQRPEEWTVAVLDFLAGIGGGDEAAT